MPETAIVIGAGIVGLATARALAIRNYKVTVIERSGKAVGASIRNFGMIWPVGQPDGPLYERAMLSKSIWKQICVEAKIGYDECGSMHAAYQKDEKQLLEEFYETSGSKRNCHLLNSAQTIEKSNAVVKENLQGSLFCGDDMIVDPREAIEKIPLFLSEKYGVQFKWGVAVTDICYPEVYSGGTAFSADEIYVCSGADFETIYPELFLNAPITKCKLQMLRLAAQQEGWRIGPALCGALSLLHYKSFAAAPSLTTLRQRLEHEYADYFKYGIHVMAAQNQHGEITIGDSHEYGLTPDPFDSNHINTLIVNYLKTFARFRNENIMQTWNGIYQKLTDGGTELIIVPEQGVTVVNGLGGAGMTLSFGLADQLITSRM